MSEPSTHSRVVRLAQSRSWTVPGHRGHVLLRERRSFTTDGVAGSEETWIWCVTCRNAEHPTLLYRRA